MSNRPAAVTMKSRTKLALAAWLCTLCLLVAIPPALAVVSEIHISVPHKTDVGQLQIRKLKVLVTVADETPVTFQVCDPRPICLPNPAAQLQPDGASYTLHAFAPTPPAPATSSDKLTITPPTTAGLAAGDPARRTYQFVISLDSNSDASCNDTMSGAETWKIQVTAGPAITSPDHGGSVCVQSLDLNASGACGVVLRPVPLTEPIAIAKDQNDNPLPGSGLGCRPGVSTVLVLDKSGSMSDMTLNSDPMKNQQKIKALHNAVSSFVDAWDLLRTNESSGTPQVQSPNDQLGVVLFDSSAVWWNAMPQQGLNVFNTTLKNTVKTQIQNVNPGTSTAIGQGLLQGVCGAIPPTPCTPTFPGPPDANRHVVLLMSNGLQNTDPMVGPDNAMNPTQIVTYPQATPNVTTPLPHQDNFQVYTVTVGTSTAVNADINRDIARAGKGFYLNTEDDAAQLTTYFTEVLQNFLKFNTQETARIVSGSVTIGTPYKSTKGFPISTTTKSAVFSLTWDATQVTNMQLTVTPPGGGKPLVQQAAGGSLLLSVPMPPPSPYDPMGDWNFQIDAFQPIISREAPRASPPKDSSVPFSIFPVAFAASPQVGITTGPSAVPFNLFVVADDVGLNSNLSVVAADYGAQDKIKLQVNVKELGDSVPPPDVVVAALVKPGNSLGDLLSSSTAGTGQSSPGDQDTPADAKLKNTLAANPSALQHAQDSVTLFDDGKPEHGDAVAGDGIYSALYPAQLPGHYNFVFAVEGKTKNVGRFSRMQVRTMYVRSTPDVGATVFQTSIQGGNTLSIVMTPRTISGDHMGPGWANYFWFTAPGQTPFKAQDNLDGTYTATLTFTGSKPPPVSVHFLRVSTVIADSVTPDHLPVPLGAGNVFVPNIQKKSCWDRIFHPSVFFFLATGMIFVGVVVYRPRRKRSQP